MKAAMEPVPYPLDYQLALARIIRERMARLRAKGAEGDAARMEKVLARLYRPDFGECCACGQVIPYFDIATDPAVRLCRRCSAR